MKKVGTPVLILTTGYELGTAFKKDNGKIGINTKIQVMESGGAYLGASAGSAFGVKLGAGIGALFGGVGAIPGGVIGGAIGGFVGGWFFGSKGGEYERKAGEYIFIDSKEIWDYGI